MSRSDGIASDHVLFSSPDEPCFQLLNRARIRSEAPATKADSTKNVSKTGEFACTVTSATDLRFDFLRRDHALFYGTRLTEMNSNRLL